MKPDSLAFINVTLPAGRLPVAILAILLVGFFVTLGLLIQKATWYKSYAQDFPTQTSTVIAGIAGFAATVLVNLCRGALGLNQMDGSEVTYFACLTMAGVGGGMLVSKRFSSPEYQDGKARIEAAKAGAAPPQVNVSGDATVNASTSTTQERAVPAVQTKMPQAGVVPSDPAVVAGLEAIAAKKAPAFGGTSND